MAKIYSNLAHTVKARELLNEAKIILTSEFPDNRYLRLQYRVAKTKYFLELRVMGHFKRSVKKLFDVELTSERYLDLPSKHLYFTQLKHGSLLLLTE